MIVLQNEGLIDLECITTMGINVKEGPNAIGYFGTGLKYAIAILLREKVDFELYIGNNEYAFYTEAKTIRGKEFHFCYMQGPSDSIALGFTTELGKNWELWQAGRELYTNCILDENGQYSFNVCDLRKKEGYTTLYIDIDIDWANIFLAQQNKELLYSSDTVDIYAGSSQHIYYQGIRAKDLDKPALFTYDLKGNWQLTEDRTISYTHALHQSLVKTLSQVDDLSMARTIITCTGDYYEAGLDFFMDSSKAPGDTFKEAVNEVKEAKEETKLPVANHSIGRFVDYYEPKPVLTKKQQFEIAFEKLRADFNGKTLPIDTFDDKIICFSISVELNNEAS